jgi:hypothetical protein
MGLGSAKRSSSGSGSGSGSGGRFFSSGPQLKAFSMSDLRAATKNFGSSSYLGEGGFGCVYKGWMDEATLAPTKPGVGRVVAIKKLRKESFQGHREWLAEVTYLGELHHGNLVSLVGYCSDSAGSNKLLVYEYMHGARQPGEPPVPPGHAAAAVVADARVHRRRRRARHVLPVWSDSDRRNHCHYQILPMHGNGGS